MANTRPNRGLPAEIPAAALVAAASLPLSRLFRPGPALESILLALAGSLAVSWALRRMRLPAVGAAAVSGLMLVWFVTVRFFAETLWGPFPSADSLRVIRLAIDAGIEQAIEEAAPVESTAPLLMFVIAGVWVTAWLTDAAAVSLRNPLLAILDCLPILAIPGAFVESPRRWLEIGSFVAAAAWLLYQDERARARRRARPAVRARAGWAGGAAVRAALIPVVVAIALSPMLPGYGEPPGFKSRGSGGRIGFNPLVAIKPTLDSSPDRELFRVRSSVPSYFRLTVLENFDGEVWSERPTDLLHPLGVSPTAPEPSVPSVAVFQEFEIRALAGRWAPAQFQPVAVTGFPDAQMDLQTRAIISREGLPSGLTYRVHSEVPDPRLGALDRPFTYDTERFRETLALPSNLPPEIREIANDIAGDEPTPLRRAIALQNHLRTFTYDENVAARHDFDTMLEFLTEVRRGYCEQFATAMAVMARSVGMPSRVAIGFGRASRVSGDLYSVRTRQAHAWVEIFFPSAGWIRFEPTPRDGVTEVPRYTVPEQAPQPSPSPTTTSEPDASPTPTQRPRAEEPGTNGGNDRQRGAFPVLPVGILAVVALALAAAMVVPRVRKKARLRHVVSGSDGVTVHYVDFLRRCASAGLGRRPAETPREHALRLSVATHEAAEPATRLALLAEEALWAPPNGLEPAEAERAAGDVRAALEPSLTRKNRFSARLGWGRWRAFGEPVRLLGRRSV